MIYMKKTPPTKQKQPPNQKAELEWWEGSTCVTAVSKHATLQ